MGAARIAELLLVLAVCAAVRVWLIRSAEVIARDGTLYVKMARELSGSVGEVVNEYDYHIGYPAAVAAVHGLLVSLGAAEGPAGWDLAGQLVSMVAGLAVVAAVWVFAGMIFEWRWAWVPALLFGVGRKWSALSADVTSDALAAALQIWAVVLGVVVLGCLRRRVRGSVLLAAVVGLCAGLGYLVRPEALLAVVLAVALWLAFALRPRAVRWRTLGACAAAAAAAAACAAPYMIAIGGLTKKKDLSDILLGQALSGRMVVASVLANPAEYVPIRQLINQLFEALHPIVATLAFVWLGLWVVSAVPGASGLRRMVRRPRPEGAFLMAAAAATIVPMLMGLHQHVGYLSHRHLIFLAALLSPLAGAGVQALVDAMMLLAGRLRLPRHRTVCLLGLVGSLLAGEAFHTLRPPHSGKGYYRQVGALLRRIARPEDRVLTHSPWVLHYGEVRGDLIRFGKRQPDWLLRLVQKTHATYLVVSIGELNQENPELRRHLRPPVFTQVREFTQAGKEFPDRICIYRIHHDAVPRVLRALRRRAMVQPADQDARRPARPQTGPAPRPAAAPSGVQ